MKTVVYTGSRYIYRNMIPCIRSLCQNGNVDEVILCIEDNSFPYELPCDVKVINVSTLNYIDKNGPNAKKRWTYVGLTKMILSKIIDRDRVLYLDADTIVEHDLSSLWEIDLKDYYYAGVKQPYQSQHGYVYLNGGVALCNLKKLRDGTDDILINAINTIDYPFCDQECIAEHLQGKVLTLPGRWNVSRYTDPDTEVYIKHFAAIGDWRYTTEEGIKYDDHNIR